MRFSPQAFSAYYSSPIGIMTRRLVRNKIYQLWPELRHYSLLGIGYPHPYLNRYTQQVERAVLTMPPVNELTPWLHNDKNCLCVSEFDGQPFSDDFFDRILISHCLEFLSNVPEVLNECRRILKPNGRILLVVPNRHSMWSRAENTPFGYGSPFTPMQIKDYLNDARFYIERMENALYAPPREHRLIRQISPFIERYGSYMFFRFGGVHVIEVSKQTFAPVKPDKGKGAWVDARKPSILIPETSGVQ